MYPQPVCAQYLTIDFNMLLQIFIFPLPFEKFREQHLSILSAHQIKKKKV